MCFQVLHLLQSRVCRGKDRGAWWYTGRENTHRSPWAPSLSSGDPVHRAQATGICGFGPIPPWNRCSTNEGVPRIRKSFHERSWRAIIWYCTSVHFLKNVSLNLFCVFCRIFCPSYKWCASVQRLFILRFSQLEYLLGQPMNCNLNLKIPLRLSRLLEQRGSDRVRTPAYLQPRRSWEMEPDLPLHQLPGSQAQLGLS